MSVKRATQELAGRDQAGGRAHAPELRAFTLIEMLVVIAIIGIMAAISVPMFSNFRKADAEAAAQRQLLDDIGRARQFAISRRSDVYMVFVPRNFWDNNGGITANLNPYNALTPLQKTNAYALLDKQLIGYNFVSLRDVGDQPGVQHPKYLTEWQVMPDGVFIPEYKFALRSATPVISMPNSEGPFPHPVYGFNYSTAIPFPVADALPDNTGNYIGVPYLAFNSLGQLISDRDQEIIPLARGTVVHPLDVNKKPLYQAPTLTEKPTTNSISSAYTIIVIDRLTGRAHVERQKPQ
ncbi:MAG: hypothetical protein RLY20_1747 [Verrucomicrobiota bacterium]|jgi:prepilin-type N-terminal cleavage/methylation domain-containing protein